MDRLKAQGIRGLIGKNDWPKFTEQEVEIFSQEQISQFFSVCDEEEALLVRQK